MCIINKKQRKHMILKMKRVPQKGHLSFVAKTPIEEASLHDIGTSLRENFREIGIVVEPQLLTIDGKTPRKRLVFLVEGTPKEDLLETFGLMKNGVVKIWSIPLTFLCPNLPSEVHSLKEGELISRFTTKGELSLAVNTKKEDEATLIKILTDAEFRVRRKQKVRKGRAMPGCIIIIPLTPSAKASRPKKSTSYQEETNLTPRDSSEIAKDFILTRINQVQWSKEELQSLAKALSKIGVGLFKTKKATVIPDSEMMVVKMIG